VRTFSAPNATHTLIASAPPRPHRAQMSRASLGLYGSMSAARLQRALLVSLELKSGRFFAPHGFKRITYFVDDLHLPDADKYGAQPPLELLRQVRSRADTAWGGGVRHGMVRPSQLLRQVRAP
jgi:hypothetical protein